MHKQFLAENSEPAGNFLLHNNRVTCAHTCSCSTGARKETADLSRLSWPNELKSCYSGTSSTMPHARSGPLHISLAQHAHPIGSGALNPADQRGALIFLHVYTGPACKNVTIPNGIYTASRSAEKNQMVKYLKK